MATVVDRQVEICFYILWHDGKWRYLVIFSLSVKLYNKQSVNWNNSEKMQYIKLYHLSHHRRHRINSSFACSFSVLFFSFILRTTKNTLSTKSGEKRRESRNGRDASWKSFLFLQKHFFSIFLVIFSIFYIEGKR